MAACFERDIHCGDCASRSTCWIERAGLAKQRAEIESIFEGDMCAVAVLSDSLGDAPAGFEFILFY